MRTRKELEEAIDKMLATSTMTEDEKAKYRAEQLEIFDKQEALRVTASNLEEQRNKAQEEIEKQKKANYNLYLETLGKNKETKEEEEKKKEEEKAKEDEPTPDELVDDVINSLLGKGEYADK